MTDNPENNKDKKEEHSESDEIQTTENEKPESKEKLAWVDDKGKKPIQYLLPIYIGIGAFLLIIWIFILIFAVQPAWNEFEKPEEPGLDIEMMPRGTQTKSNQR